MLKEEFNRLMNLFAQGAEGQAVNLDEVFKQSLVFFDHLNAQLQKGTDEEKKEAFLMMSEMYTQMMQQTKKISEKTGMSEEQLARYSENPSNFSPEQWAGIQEARRKMQVAGRGIAEAVHNLDSEIRHAKKPEAPASSQEEKKGRTSGKRAKKSQWMRS